MNMNYTIPLIMIMLLFAGCLSQQQNQTSQDKISEDNSVALQPTAHELSVARQEEAASASSQITGMNAPDFTLPQTNNKTISLSDLKGKWIVLYFYPKDKTPGCTIQANEFTTLENEFKKLNTQILGISADSTQSHQEFTDQFNLNIDLLSDVDHQIMAKYGAWVETNINGEITGRPVRTTVLIDPQGTISYHWPEVIPEGHAKRVLEKLQEKQEINQ